MKNTINIFSELSDDMYNVVIINNPDENKTVKAIRYYLDYLFLYLEYVLGRNDSDEKSEALVSNLKELKQSISPLIEKAYTKLQITREIGLNSRSKYMDTITSEVVEKMNNFCDGDICYVKYHAQDVFGYLENIARANRRERNQTQELCHCFTTAKGYLVLFMGIS